jgi:hypothetical protein
MMVEHWQTRDYGGAEGKAVSLSKKGLGEFFFHLFSMQGRLVSSFCLNAAYHGSYVQLLIELPEGMKEKFEQESGFALEKPARIQVA